MTEPPALLPEIAAFLARRERVAKHHVPRLLDLSPVLRAVAEELMALTDHWNPVEIYAADPASIMAEKARFLEANRSGRAFNPRFTYGYAQAFLLEDAQIRLRGLLAHVRAQRPGT